MKTILNDEIRTKGRARFWVYEGDIEWKRRSDGILVRRNPLLEDSGWMDNGIVTVGKDLLLDRLFGLNGPPAAVASIGVGDNNAGFLASQQHLQASTNVLIQTQDTSPTAYPNRTAEAVTNQGTFGTGVANFNWQECGLFNGNSNTTSTMLDRLVIGPFNKTSAVSIVLQIVITQS